MSKEDGFNQGRFSNEETNYIREHLYDSPEKVGHALNRGAASIKKFLERHKLVPVDEEEKDHYLVTLANKLHRSVYWKQLPAQTSEEERQFFETVWIAFLVQFNEDILPSEELDLKDMIMLEILKNRSLKDRQTHIEEAEELEKIRDGLVRRDREAEDSGEDGYEHSDTIAQMTDQVLAMRGAISSYTAEHAKFLEKGAALSKNLKIQRADRVKRIEDSKTTWAGYIRILEDAQKRREEGAEIEIMRAAKDHATRKFSQLHTYEDGTVDRPFLTPETVLLDDEE